MDSRLLKFLLGEGYFLHLSGPERLLLEFALDRFGEPLTRFLLSGLGEDSVVPEWIFTVTFSDGQGVRYSREVRVRADDRPDIVPRVPRHREPLVVLALLWLLLVNPKLSSFTLTYDYEEALGVLGWEDTQESRLRIDEAVKRYSALYYQWTLDNKELAAKGLSFYDELTRFISGYGYQSLEEEGERKRVSGYVSFAEEFVRELLRRSLFGINWDSVTSVQRIRN